MDRDYKSLVRSLERYRDEGESPEDWLVLELDSVVDTDGLVSANEMAFDMAICAAELAYEAGKKDGYTIGFEERQEDDWHAGFDAVKERADQYLKGFEAAAKEPRFWYLKDKNGDPLHLFDKAKTSDGVVMVTAITASIDPMENRILGCSGESEWEHKPWMIEKVTPDTREKIIKELADWLESGCSYHTCNDLAEQFVSRVEALGVDHE